MRMEQAEGEIYIFFIILTGEDMEKFLINLSITEQTLYLAVILLVIMEGLKSLSSSYIYEKIPNVRSILSDITF